MYELARTIGSNRPRGRRPVKTAHDPGCERADVEHDRGDVAREDRSGSPAGRGRTSSPGCTAAAGQRRHPHWVIGLGPDRERRIRLGQQRLVRGRGDLDRDEVRQEPCTSPRELPVNTIANHAAIQTKKRRDPVDRHPDRSPGSQATVEKTMSGDCAARYSRPQMQLDSANEPHPLLSRDSCRSPLYRRARPKRIRNGLSAVGSRCSCASISCRSRRRLDRRNCASRMRRCSSGEPRLGRRYGGRAAVGSERDARQVRRVGVFDRALEDVLGLDPHADLHRAGPGGIDARGEGHQRAHVDRNQEVHPVHPHRHYSRARVLDRRQRGGLSVSFMIMPPWMLPLPWRRSAPSDERTAPGFSHRLGVHGRDRNRARRRADGSAQRAARRGRENRGLTPPSGGSSGR